MNQEEHGELLEKKVKEYFIIRNNQELRQEQINHKCDEIMRLAQQYIDNYGTPYKTKK